MCNTYDFDCLDGLSEKKLTNRLSDIKFDKYSKIGIILDADKEGISKRIELINTCIKSICNDVVLTKINEFIKSNELDIEIGCYITNIDGFGELETMLKAIKSKPSIYADCLDSWRECVEANGKNIKDKDFDKFWVSNYLRFDTCTKQEQKQSEKNCKNEIAIKKDIWDFSSQKLDDLKEFLNLLSN